VSDAPAPFELRRAFNLLRPGMLKRVYRVYRSAYADSYSQGRGESLNISNGSMSDPTPDVAIDKADLRAGLEYHGRRLVAACEAIDRADAFFAELSGELKYRSREQRSKAGEV
jgi:hypothetical protein